MYQALYRKWRPKTFDDVVGQNRITETLKNEIKSGRISHAYLFTGSRGTGKTSCAKILAKAVNCLNPQNGNPCDECEICKGINDETILDVTEIDAASNNSVENIRSMREEVVFTPAKCKYRVYIVDEVHMLSSGAFNAFLKTLEEPPSHVIFILATTEVHKLPATIISRCQRFDFHRISSEDICKRLKYVCDKENIIAEDAALKIVATAADGAMRDALSILERCVSTEKKLIDEKTVKNILGIPENEYTEDLIKNLKCSNMHECLSFVAQMHQQSKNMHRLCEEIMEYLRNLLVESFKTPGNQQLHLKTSEILYALNIFQEAYKNTSLGMNPKLELEIALIKICEKFQNNCEFSKTDEPTDKSNDKLTEKKQSENLSPNKTESALQGPDKPSNKPLWDNVLEQLKTDKSLKSLYISLKGSKAYEKDNLILIDSQNSLSFDLLRKPEYRNALKEIIKKITGKQYSLGPYKDKANQNQEDSPKIASCDPLENLLNDAQSQGINIKINQEEINK